MFIWQMDADERRQWRLTINRTVSGHKPPLTKGDRIEIICQQGSPGRVILISERKSGFATPFIVAGGAEQLVQQGLAEA